MNEPRIIPKFASEKEEADWWFENREPHAEEFIAAAAEGRVKRGNLADHYHSVRQATTVTLDSETATEARELAKRRGQDVATVLKRLIHEAFQQENRLAS